MKVFGITEAKYYCSRFGNSAGDATKSIKNFQKNHLGGRSQIIVEGTSLFQQYQDCSLREIERSLFFAASHYRRSLDLMISSSSPWVFVTLYYGSWYASQALLGMFGCTVFGSKLVVDVHKGTPGQQQLRLRKIGKKTGQVFTTYSGPHRIFWSLFYDTVQSLKPMVDSYFSSVLSPISGDPVWQIENRNNVNYDTYIGFDLATGFDCTFQKENFPNCLPGILNTQFRILETMLELDYHYAGEFGINTDALNVLGTPMPLRQKVRNLIYNEKPPGLVKKTKKAIVT